VWYFKDSESRELQIEWFISVIPDREEAEIGRIMDPGHARQKKVSETSSQQTS
jgi:hypothetical protein